MTPNLLPMPVVAEEPQDEETRGPAQPKKRTAAKSRPVRPVAKPRPSPPEDTAAAAAAPTPVGVPAQRGVRRKERPASSSSSSNSSSSDDEIEDKLSVADAVDESEDRTKRTAEELQPSTPEKEVKRVRGHGTQVGGATSSGSRLTSRAIATAVPPSADLGLMNLVDDEAVGWIADVEEALKHHTITKDDIWRSRIAEINKLAVDFSVFEPVPRRDWNHRVLGYHGVGTVKDGEARARFTVADLRNKTDRNEVDMFCQTQSPVSLKIMELKALE